MESRVPALPEADSPRLPGKNGWLIGWGVLWLLLIGAGMAWTMKFEGTAGPATVAPAVWPRDSRLSRAIGRPTLIMFAHPKCSCTRASLAELAALMDEARGAVTAQVIFYHPAGTSPAWARTELWETAAAIPGVSVSADEENREAARFGGSTSGGTLLFDAAGRLLFHGGITDARGQSGESTGRWALLELIAGRAGAVHQTAVFGCPLQAGTSSLATACPLSQP